MVAMEAPRDFNNPQVQPEAQARGLPVVMGRVMRQEQVERVGHRVQPRPALPVAQEALVPVEEVGVAPSVLRPPVQAVMAVRAIAS